MLASVLAVELMNEGYILFIFRKIAEKIISKENKDIH